MLTFARFLRDNANQEFEVFCVLDRDYHSDTEITERMQQAKDAGISLHIWSHKELENYVVQSSTIARLLSHKSKTNVSTGTVDKAIDALVDEAKETSFDAFSETLRQQMKSGADKSNAAARPVFNKRWKEVGGRAVVAGKQLMADLSTWSQSKYHVSLSLAAVLREMRPDEAPKEVAELLRSLTV